MKFHYLLSFAGRSELENMAERDKLTLLQKIVTLPGSEEAWKAILELLASWPHSPAKQYALDWTDSALETWNDELRSVNSSLSYIYDIGGLADFTRIFRSLHIDGRETYGNEELTIIAKSPQLSKLRRLSIYQSEIYREGLQALAAAPWLAGLTHLLLASLTLDREKLAILFDSTKFNSLSVLTLRNMGIQHAELLLLSKAVFLEQLTSLDLSYNMLTGEDIVELEASGRLKKLRYLNISHNYITTEEVPQLRKLFQHLQLTV